MRVLAFTGAVVATVYVIGTVVDWRTCDGPTRSLGPRLHEMQHAFQLARAALFVAVAYAWLLGVRP